MASKRDIILQLRALESAPRERVCVIDPTAPSDTGTMDQMSLAELRARLEVVKRHQQEEVRGDGHMDDMLYHSNAGCSLSQKHTFSPTPHITSAHQSIGWRHVLMQGQIMCGRQGRCSRHGGGFGKELEPGGRNCLRTLLPHSEPLHPGLVQEEATRAAILARRQEKEASLLAKAAKIGHIRRLACAQAEMRKAQQQVRTSVLPAGCSGQPWGGRMQRWHACADPHSMTPAAAAAAAGLQGGACQGDRWWSSPLCR